MLKLDFAYRNLTESYRISVRLRYFKKDLIFNV